MRFTGTYIFFMEKNGGGAQPRDAGAAFLWSFPYYPAGGRITEDRTGDRVSAAHKRSFFEVRTTDFYGRSLGGGIWEGQEFGSASRVGF